MSTVLAPTASLTTGTRETWRLAPGSHLAVCLDRHGVPAPMPVSSGNLAIDVATGIGSLTITFAAGGTLRGIATRGDRDIHGCARWTVRGTFDMAGRTFGVTLALRDHGIIRSRGTWWWLSGTGDEERCARRPRQGSRIVADLLLTPARGTAVRLTV